MIIGNTRNLFRHFKRLIVRHGASPFLTRTDLMSSFSRGLLRTTTQGLSDRAGLGAGMEGDLEGDGWPTAFLLVLGVASLF